MIFKERNKFDCEYEKKCRTRNQNPNKCKTCKNNRMRNYEPDYYEAANDNEPPEKCPTLHYSGPFEQTSGYKCPVCEEYTHPAQVISKRCKHCGYILNIG